ncbi:protein flp-like [Mya arenaria]|uniref:protein flp-like n=1 Tax=Mya arenaria TaxID=6604 RepID=UPI0022E67A6B|nr:protein flp-like [Mya arenaria]
MIKSILIVVVSYEIFGRSLTENSDFIFDQDKRNKLELFINSTIECSGIIGLSLSLVHNRTVLYSEGFGFTDIKQGRKATGSSKFAIGSLTKAFTSALFADLIEENETITWDTKVKDILGGSFKLIDGREREITIRDLLAHKTGLLDYSHMLISDVISAEELLRRIRYMPASDALRTRFHYNNYMYTVAGMVVERLGKDEWGNLVANRFLRPLHMNDTGFLNESSSPDDLSDQFVMKDGSPVAIDRSLVRSLHTTAPAGAIISTADDMAKWMMFHLNEGRDEDGRQIADLQPTYEGEMVLPMPSEWLPGLPYSEVSVSYNMGWMTHAYRGYRRVGHTGGVHSFQSQCYLFPDKKTGLFLVMNGPRSKSATKMSRLIALYVSDLLIEEKPWLNASTACSFPDPWYPQAAPPPPPPPQHYTWNITQNKTDYVGTYSHKGFGDIKVNIENGTHLLLEYGKYGKMHVYPINETSFLGIHVGKMWFITSADDGMGPLSLGFAIKEKVNGLLFPLNFVGQLTRFDKIDKRDERDSASVEHDSASVEHDSALNKPAAALAMNIASNQQVIGGQFVFVFVTCFCVIFCG